MTQRTTHDGYIVPTRHTPISDLGILSNEERLGLWSPRPRDLPAYRDRLVVEWLPGGPLRRAAQVIRDAGGHHFAPDWECRTLAAADLWFVGSSMCDLLAAAAPTMPATPLTPQLAPDEFGLVVFQSPLSGIDAEGGDHPVAIAGYLWGSALLVLPGAEPEPVLGVTVYGPSSTRDPLALWPLGGLTWRYGHDTDDPDDPDDRPSVAASMAEDRRLLVALWLLSQQPGLATSERRVHHTRNRAKQRRTAGQAPPPPVRVVHLRHTPAPDHGAPTETGRRTYRHRWAVSGHWRSQAYGKGWSERRPLYINPYLKGPAGAPLIGGERVKAWTR